MPTIALHCIACRYLPLEKGQLDILYSYFIFILSVFLIPWFVRNCDFKKRYRKWKCFLSLVIMEDQKWNCQTIWIMILVRDGNMILRVCLVCIKVCHKSFIWLVIEINQSIHHSNESSYCRIKMFMPIMQADTQ